MIVIRVIGNSLRERLLRIDNLSLEDAIKIDQEAEATKKNTRMNYADHKKTKQ